MEKNSKSSFSAATFEKGNSTIKIPYCNNPNITTPFLQHMNHPIAIFENHLLQHPKNPLATRRNSKKRTNSKGMGSRCSLLQPLPITFELAGGRRE